MNIPLLNTPILSLSIVIPAYNEEARIGPTLRSAVSYLNLKGVHYEMLVVDDGSSDRTSGVCKEIATELSANIKVVSLHENQGKGAAITKGMLECLGHTVGFMDADGATPIEELGKILPALNDFDIAIGSRALYSSDSTVKTVWYRKFLGRVFNSVVNIIALPGIKDTQCGFKFFQRSAAQKIFPLLQTKRFGIDVEILYVARKLNLKIKETPINWTNIPGSKVNLLKDSAQMFFDVLKVMARHSATKTS